MTGTRADFDTITKGESTSGALRDSDPAELGQLTATVERILPAIERLWRYEGRDDAAGRRPGWLARLDVGLPEAGGGVEAVRRVEDDGIDSFQPPDQACCRWLMQDKSPPGQIKTVTRLRGASSRNGRSVCGSHPDNTGVSPTESAFRAAPGPEPDHSL